MDALIYTIMSGANRTLKAQQVRANNLANADTPGFRADIEVASSQAVPGYGYDARHMTVLQPSAVSVKQGVIAQTGRELDVAIQGEGFFTVATASGEAYTRGGQFDVAADGTLMLGGRQVLGDGGAIVLPAHRQVQVAADGTVSVLPPGSEAMQAVGRLKLVKPAPEELSKTSDGLIVSRLEPTLAADDTVRVQGGHLERSNVSAVEEMIASMTLNRSFEMQLKMFNAANDMVEAGNRLVRG
ncbi:flagellar basal body rod protein FlgF [Vogesella indigofera]|uniref:flagellar basal body rod protein FlgF n=1 Tax=Vogesella indigofera TaxID=45465 RepID=UPI00234D32FF|nr:flagellar basal body rod protein FlgF [Vogesella indigofera]MDC7703435.1 flagellar basal body rod protein FlgF [Vogesella indigofera]